MPVEIKELIIEGNLVRRMEDSAEPPGQLLTAVDKDNIKAEVIAEIRADKVLGTTERRELIEEILGEVRKMLEDGWRR